MMHADAIHSVLLDQNPWWQDATRRRATAYPVRRDLHARLLQHLGRVTERRAALLVGPRQVGKTVLLLQVADDLLERGLPAANITYFDFSDDRIPRGITPREVSDIQHTSVAKEHPRIFLFDEISKSENWGPWLKQAVDTGRDRYVVTDSAASLLRGEARESGQGRWDELRIEGVSFAEFLRLVAAPGEPAEETLRRLPNAVERYLAVGGFPEHATSEYFSEVRERVRADIADRAIRRDLIGLGVDVERVKDLFVYLVQDSGAIFNARSRAQDIEADQRSVAQWVRVLEDAHLIVRLDRHTARASARLRSQPRVYATDHGLVAAFTPSPSPLTDPAVRARVVEAAVFRHLRAVAASQGGDLSFFRKDDSLEADFVLEVPAGRIAIEVTASPSPRSRKFKTLLQIGEALKTSNLILIHGGVLEGKPGSIRPIALPRFLLDPSSIVEDFA